MNLPSNNNSKTSTTVTQYFIPSLLIKENMNRLVSFIQRYQTCLWFLPTTQFVKILKAKKRRSANIFEIPENTYQQQFVKKLEEQFTSKGLSEVTQKWNEEWTYFWKIVTGNSNQKGEEVLTNVCCINKCVLWN